MTHRIREGRTAKRPGAKKKSVPASPPTPEELARQEARREREKQRDQDYRYPARASTITVSRLVDSEIPKGKIRIPVFQRSLVWSDADVLHMLDSLRRGYHIGTIILWEQYGVPNTVPCLGGAIPTDGSASLVIDGQQRLAGLHTAFRSGRFGYDLSKKVFVVDQPASRQVIPLGYLINENTDALFAWIDIHTKDVSGIEKDAVFADFGHLKDDLYYREIAYVMIPHGWPLAEVVDMFRRLNTAGVRITAEEVEVCLGRALNPAAAP